MSSNYHFSPSNGVGQPGSAVQAGGGGNPFFRDPLDARRSMAGYVPSAEYPDGYLGTIQSRREDRLLNQLKNRLNQRSYQRGVHKGEKVDPADYMWPPEFGPMTGIQRQVTGQRFAPIMTTQELMTAYGDGPPPRGAGALLAQNPPNIYDPTDLGRLAPPWK